MSDASALARPLRLGSAVTRNRILLPGMGVELAGPDGTPNDAVIAYYAARARGGAGIVVAGYAATASPCSHAGPNQLALVDPRQVPKWARLAAAVQREGSLLLVELAHAGLQRPAGLGGPAFGPSEPPATAGGTARPPVAYAPPEPLDAGGISAVVDGFARSARWARQAGADGVELHAAHGYLLHQFLSPRTNRRQDRWGGGRDGRMLLLRQVVEAVRAELGGGVLGVRLNGWDGLPDGIAPDEGEAMAAALAADGRVDYLSLSSGGPGTEWRSSSIAPYLVEPGATWTFAERVRARVSVPVVAVGSIATAAQAEAVLARGVDMVAVGRSFLADPDWGRRALAGRPAEIRPCIRCNRCREEENAWHEVRCTVNPHLGREGLPRPSGLGRVLVAGGGPAGISAALAAAEAGASVELFTSGESAGGAFRRAARLPRRDEQRRLLRHWEDRLAHLGVRVHTGRRLDPDDAGAAGWSAVVVALGAEVQGRGDGETTWDLLERRPDGSLLVADTSLLGTELALAWADAGRPVYLAGDPAALAADAPPFLRRVVLALTEEAGIRLVPAEPSSWPRTDRVALPPVIRPRGEEAGALAAGAGGRALVVPASADLLVAVHRGQAAGEAGAAWGRP